MRITVIGTGYVGLVTGACFSETGNHVTCVDVDAGKIARLNAGEVPIFEPGLAEMIQRNATDDRLRFTTSLKEGLTDAEVCFIAVGTPAGDDGSADLTHVLAVARQLGETISESIVVVDKSTVPVGTADRVRDEISAALAVRGADIEFDVVSNPEFLAEGAAIEDFMRPDRVIVGTDSERAAALMHELYEPFARSREKMIVMGLRDAEMTKYVANAMLATRVSFMNEMAALCELLGVDVEMVRLGIGADPRIGHRFLYPGAGYGGSCFPKDVKALIHAARETGFDPAILDAVEGRNTVQKKVLFEKLERHYDGNLAGKVIALWGLAFKPGTDDMREAPSLALIERLVAAGARVRAFDPVATQTAHQALKAMGIDAKGVEIVDEQYAALDGADALVLVTEWKQFRQPDFKRIAKQLRAPVIVDGRNQYNPTLLRERGFAYYAVGR
ncbi:MAG: UDP-glucose/GDP-mannose dehydrogenase family protein [Gammaproteobacteria bacterium]